MLVQLYLRYRVTRHSTRTSQRRRRPAPPDNNPGGWCDQPPGLFPARHSTRHEVQGKTEETSGRQARHSQRDRRLFRLGGSIASHPVFPRWPTVSPSRRRRPPGRNLPRSPGSRRRSLPLVLIITPACPAHMPRPWGHGATSRSARSRHGGGSLPRTLSRHAATPQVGHTSLWGCSLGPRGHATTSGATPRPRKPGRPDRRATDSDARQRARRRQLRHRSAGTMHR